MENEQVKKKSTLAKKALFGAVMLIAVLFAMYTNRYHPAIYKYFNVFFAINLKTDSYPTIPLPFGQNNQSVADDSGVYILTQDSLIHTDKSGVELWNAKVSLQNPQLAVEGKYELAYDMGGKELYVFNSGKLAYTAQAAISNVVAKVNQNGFLVVAVKQFGYRGQVYAYNNKGELVYQWQSGDKYIIDVDISPDNKSIIASVASGSTGQMAGGLYLFNIGSDTPVGTAAFDDVVTNVAFHDQSSIVAVGLGSIQMFDRKMAPRWKYAYEGVSISNFDISDKSSIALCFNQGKVGTDSTVYILDYYGKKRGAYQSGGSVHSVSVQGDYVVIAGDKNIETISSAGANILSAKTLERTAKEVQFLPTGELLIKTPVDVQVVRIK